MEHVVNELILKKSLRAEDLFKKKFNSLILNDYSQK